MQYITGEVKMNSSATFYYGLQYRDVLADHQRLFMDTGCSLDNLLAAMDDREG